MRDRDLPEVVASLRLGGKDADEAFEQIFGLAPDMRWKQGEPKAAQHRRPEDEDGASISACVHPHSMEDAFAALFARVGVDVSDAGVRVRQRNLRVFVGIAVYGGARPPGMTLGREHIETIHALQSVWLDIDMSHTPWRDEAK